MTARTIDHVALWVADRDAIAERLIADLGMHTIERTDRFTLLGADARRFKLTLFDEEGPRAQGALKDVTLRVNEGEPASHDVGEGLTVNIVQAPTEVDYDLDHVALFSADPKRTAEEYLRFGFDSATPSSDGHPRVTVGGAFVEFHPGDPGDPDKPLLNHLAVLVDSVDEHIAEAEEMGVVDNVVDAANTRAVFVWGPDRVRIEYVEHKPEFALT